VVSIGRAEAVDSLVERWRDRLHIAGSAPEWSARLDERLCREAGEALKRAVWDPVAAHVGDARRVFLVPDGALNLVTFAALPAGTSYLLERGPLLHYLSAERDLVRSDPAPSRGGLLAVGGPDFDSAPGATVSIAARAPSAPAYRGARATCGDFRSLHFAPLPAAAREVSEVAALWRRRGGGTPVLELTGSRATTTAFAAASPGQRVVHLATHGYFLGEQCPSALGGGGAEGMGVRDRVGHARLAGDNPLLLSGLVLAGANRRTEVAPMSDDGVLTAEEIASLDLSGVEWAVLSACETGVGEVRSGEGVFGLRRAFQVAGVRTLIMSMWAVEDTAALRWTTALYRARLERRMATAEAVRAASLEVLRERRAKHESTHPFYWAPFVAAGDWR
jgi:CHAT domain-containing protein